MEFFIRKDSVINNFKRFQKIIYKNSLLAFKKSKFKNNTYYLNKKAFIKNISKSFDYAILEKTKDINAIKLNKTPNAYLLTVIRGVGKPTTARLIAKSLNCSKNFEKRKKCTFQN